MEIKLGNQQTEVGVIPEDWVVVRAIDVCDLVVDCKNRTPPFVGESPYCVVRTPNVRDGQFVLADLRFTDEASFRAWTERAVPRLGDIMITREAPLGEVCPVPADRKVCLGQRMMLYRPSAAKLDSDYLLYALQSTQVRGALLRKIGGSTVGHARVDDIRFLEIPLPPLREQRAIADALRDVDALLGTLGQVIAKKRDLKQAAMKQLLTGQTRLPGFSGDWDKRRLGDIVSIFNGGTPRTDEPSFWDGNIAWCTPTDITKTPGKYLAFTERTISEAGLRDCSGQLLPAGAILLCTRATIGEVKIAAREVCTNQGFKSLVASKGVDNEFLYYALLMMKAAMIERATGSTFLELSKKDTASLSLPMPAYAEQSAIAIILSDMDVELSALEDRRDKTRLLRQGMMQELLTGRTRLV